MPYLPMSEFSIYSGSKKPKLLILGETLSVTDLELRRSFAGSSGKELFLCLGEAMPEVEPELHAQCVAQFHYGHAWLRLRDAWLEAAGIGLTQVFDLQPPGGKLESLCVQKKELPDKGKNYVLSPIAPAKYLLPVFQAELERSKREIISCKPNLVLALGVGAVWSLTGKRNLASIRGTVSPLRIQDPQSNRPALDGKLLASYSPRIVQQMWSYRPVLVQDLMKAKREMEFGEIRRPRREVLVSPTLREINLWIEHMMANPPAKLSCDIETAYGQITCIGFATGAAQALVIPFMDKTKANWSYWATQAEEELAWLAVRRLLLSRYPKLFQNGLYDMQYLFRMGLRINNASHDTMLLHHSILPELQKGLGFLGSVYTDEPAWKLMRKAKPDTEKRDE